MIYRVDYLLAVILSGVIVGVLVSRRTANIEPGRLARGYFVIIAMLLAIRAAVFVCGIVLANGAVWNTIGSGIGDGSNFLLGGIVGIASRRSERREILCDPSVYSALCLSAGFSFVIAGYAKAFYMEGMTQFFAQSGYSTPFLKFIMTIEVLGGIGLLIPWTVLSAIAGLSIDMFGAIFTHIHNGDSINDSTGAISALIRFGVILTLWAWRPRHESDMVSMRQRFVGIAIAAALCAAAAAAGSALMRRQTPRLTAALVLQMSETNSCAWRSKAPNCRCMRRPDHAIALTLVPLIGGA